MAKVNAVPVYQEQQENQQVRHDLWTVIILNAIFFAILFGLYFWNRNTGVVEQFFGKFIKL